MRLCVAVRAPPPPSAEEMDLCHLGPLMAVYISIYMCMWEGRGDGARTLSPGQICPGWLTSPHPPLFLPPPNLDAFTQHSEIPHLHSLSGRPETTGA